MEHPAVYQLVNYVNSFRLRVYIWNLTFGGRIQLPDEWRIQVTGLPVVRGGQQFVPDIGGKTVILGWCEELEVFAAYDIRKHLGILGGSPSIQIRQPALEKARINGLASHFKGEEEVAFAIKPSYMAAYLENMEDLHACGSSEEALRILDEICKDPNKVNEKDIQDHVPELRRWAVVSTKKALRDANFKDRVLTAYSQTCAMCGVQLRLIDAAHLLPAAHPESTDETSNGIALCALHHRAFDSALVTFDVDYRIHRNLSKERELANSGLDVGLAGFSEKLLPQINLPQNLKDRPSSKYLEKVNAMRGWAV
ncbi:hypothetical protein A3843_14340 [Pseudovibrio exalbescens]|uniref:Uncharacterized protein n=2 Tax=Pseudovibrio exalbescens TaxID=197461 RepID=A0A1U7JF68_9HYPH|nr:hypothetical protein A3843_14340 [Pseudovibrio exalbescens]